MHHEETNDVSEGESRVSCCCGYAQLFAKQVVLSL